MCFKPVHLKCETCSIWKSTLVLDVFCMMHLLNGQICCRKKDTIICTYNCLSKPRFNAATGDAAILKEFTSQIYELCSLTEIKEIFFFLTLRVLESFWEMWSQKRNPHLPYHNKDKYKRIRQKLNGKPELPVRSRPHVSGECCPFLLLI